MAHDPIDTLGKARHNMLIKAECSCGNVRYCRSADLTMVYGGGFGPLKLEFDCSRCRPEIKVTLLEVHPEPQLFHKFLNLFGKIGAQRRIRTTDTRIFSPLLYQLSYLGLFRHAGSVAHRIS